MTTIIMPILSRQVDLQELKKIAENLICDNPTFYLLCENKSQVVLDFEKLSEKQKSGFNLAVYPIGTSEESMIDDCIKNIEAQDFVLVRNDCSYFSADSVNKLLLQAKGGFDIVMPNSVGKVNWFKKLINKVSLSLCDMLFNFTFYQGDIGLQFFGKQACEIMQVTNSVKLTKLNRWVALTISYVDLDIETTIVKKKNFKNYKKKAWLFSGLFSFVLIGSIVWEILATVPFLVWVALVLILFILLMVSLYALLNVYCVSKLGNLNCERIESIKLEEKK